MKKPDFLGLLRYARNDSASFLATFPQPWLLCLPSSFFIINQKSGFFLAMTVQERKKL